MKIFLLIFLLTGAFVKVYAQPNCNIYKDNKSCYEACLEAEKAILHPQGSAASQTHFDKAIALCPTFAYAYREKSVPYLKRGDFVTWKALIDKAVEISPQEFLGIRGWCRYQFLRDYKGAIRDIEKLEAMANYDIGAGVNGDYHLIIAKALCYKALNQKDKAIRIIIKQLEQEEYAVMAYDYLHLGVLYLEIDKPDKAVSTLLKQIEVNDYLAETYYYLGKAKSALGEKAKALNYFQKALTFYKDGKHLLDPYTHPMDRVYEASIVAEISKVD